MEKKEFLMSIEGDLQNKYSIIFNEDEFITIINSEEKHYNYSDISNIKMPPLALIKNVNFQCGSYNKCEKYRKWNEH